MRSTIAILTLVCAVATPAFCQKEQNSDPDSAKARELKACGPRGKEQKISVHTDKKTHPTGEQTADKSLLYIVRPRPDLSFFTGVMYSSNVAADGEWKGGNHTGTYFFFTLEPGTHYFCSDVKHHRSVLVFTTEPGKTYYIEQQVSAPSGSIAGMINTLTPLSEGEGKILVGEADASIWRGK
jgi:hypothetical protein